MPRRDTPLEVARGNEWHEPIGSRADALEVSSELSGRSVCGFHDADPPLYTAKARPFGVVALTLRAPGSLLDLLHHSQDIAAQDLLHVGDGVALGHERGRELG